ncbi:MAG: hypothetical protein QM756_25940 [Polyangiaceae bacterium]
MHGTHKRKWLWFVVPVAGVALYLVLWLVADSGRSPPADGLPVVARVVSSGDGNCVVGAKRQHCYHLRLELKPADQPAREVELDVNIEDRFASRVQAGAWLRAVQDRTNPERVFIDIDALSAPAPTPP